MTYKSAIVCDGCGKSEPSDPDDGTPAGWFLLAKMDRTGGWNEEHEWHFCSSGCVTNPAKDGAA